MTREPDFVGLLEDYLDGYEGATPLPESVRDAIRANLPTTKQVGPLARGMRYPRMFPLPLAARFGLVAAVVILAAAMGASFLGRGIGGPHGPTAPRASALPLATPSPTVTATPGELPAAAELAPGTYFMRNPYIDQDPVRSCVRGCADYRRITFTLPDGWATRDGLVYKHMDQPGEVAFSAWTPDQVYDDPCHWQGSALSPLLDIHDHTRVPALGSTALENQVGRDASAPSGVTLGGQLALRIELSIPAELELPACDSGEFRSWSEWDVVDGGNSHHAPGQIDVVYIVDVDRRPLVIDASHMPETSAEDLAELEGILASIRIDR